MLQAFAQALQGDCWFLILSPFFPYKMNSDQENKDPLYPPVCSSKMVLSNHVFCYSCTEKSSSGGGMSKGAAPLLRSSMRDCCVVLCMCWRSRLSLIAAIIDLWESTRCCQGSPVYSCDGEDLLSKAAAHLHHPGDSTGSQWKWVFRVVPGAHHLDSAIFKPGVSLC